MITRPVICGTGAGEVTQASRNSCDGDGDGKQIMLSYNWGSKDLMLRIRDRLKEEGYKVWMDVDNMSE